LIRRRRSGAPSTAPCDHGPTGFERADVPALYQRYLTRCNEHRFDSLGEFVSEQVSGSGAVDGLAGYIYRIKALCTVFPDYCWELQELVVEAAAPNSTGRSLCSATRWWPGRR
jgi:predicted ester cyclase